VNGFLTGALVTRSSGREVLLLMDGEDLLAVLEGRIGLDELVVRKRRHAAQTGESFFSVKRIFSD